MCDLCACAPSLGAAKSDDRPTGLDLTNPRQTDICLTVEPIARTDNKLTGVQRVIFVKASHYES